MFYTTFGFGFIRCKSWDKTILMKEWCLAVNNSWKGFKLWKNIFNTIYCTRIRILNWVERLWWKYRCKIYYNNALWLNPWVGKLKSNKQRIYLEFILAKKQDSLILLNVKLVKYVVRVNNVLQISVIVILKPPPISFVFS